MRALAFVGFFLTLLSTARADSLEVSLKEGDKAPAFKAVDSKGEVWNSEDHVGKKVIVVYFYPADLTSGCTAQACAYRDHMKELEEADVEVVGVSGDSHQTHQLFARIHALNFPLLSDADGKVAEAFGVPFTKGEKTAKAEIDGKETTFVRQATIQRYTYLIGKDGKIAAVYKVADAAGDSKKILELAKELK